MFVLGSEYQLVALRLTVPSLYNLVFILGFAFECEYDLECALDAVGLFDPCIAGLCMTGLVLLSKLSALSPFPFTGAEAGVAPAVPARGRVGIASISEIVIDVEL